MQKVFALSANYGYLGPVTALVKSIVQHNHDSKIYWINTDVPQEWFAVVNYRIKKYGCRIVDRKISDDMLADLHASHDHINVLSFGRIFIPQLIPEDRVLYIDSDAVVTADLTDLFNIDLGDYYLAAVPNVVQEDDHPTFNSGVVLFNNRKFHEHPEALKKMLDEGKGNKDLREGDQTLLNDLTGNDYYKLPFRYNYIIGYDQFAYYQYHGNYPSYVNAINDSKHRDIIHFASPDKPWQLLSSGRMRSTFWHYENLPWSFHQLQSSRHYQGHLMMMTYSADIQNIIQLVTKLPNYHFDICTWTGVAWPLQEIMKYPNVTVHRWVIDPILNQLIRQSDAYLDISIGPKDKGIPERLLNIQEPVLTFDSTWNHDLPDSQVFYHFADNDINGMIDQIKKICVHNN